MSCRATDPRPAACGRRLVRYWCRLSCMRMDWTLRIPRPPSSSVLSSLTTRRFSSITSPNARPPCPSILPSSNQSQWTPVWRLQPLVGSTVVPSRCETTRPHGLHSPDHRFMKLIPQLLVDSSAGKSKKKKKSKSNLKEKSTSSASEASTPSATAVDASDVKSDVGVEEHSTTVCRFSIHTMHLLPSV